MSVLLSILPDPDHDKKIVAGWPELFSHSGASTAGRGPLRQLYPTLVSGKRSGSGAHSFGIPIGCLRLSAALPIPLYIT